MAGSDVKVTISVVDNASRSFQTISDGADKMGREIEESAQQSSRSFKDMERDARNVGLGIGVLIGSLALAGQSFRDQEIALDTLRRGYGDAADDMERFANQLQETTNYSNDSAVAAANVFRTLGENYGYTAEQIQQLITISADLAATTGISLADAATRVQSAMRGEAEAAEYLGLTLNDHALGIDRLSTSTSEYEKSQIRFNALQEQSAFAMGAAQQQAEGAYGAVDQLADSFQDGAQRVGEFLGPLGEIGAFAADNAVKMGLMALALAQLGSAASSLNALTTAMTGVNVASKAMTLSLGPVGIAAAAGLAAVGLYQLWQNADGMVPAIQKAEEHLGDLEQTVRELYAMGSTLGSLGERATEGIFPDLSADIAEIEDLQDKIAGTNAVIGQMSGADLEKANADLETWSFRLMEIADKYGILDASMLEATITQQDVIDGMDDLNAILANTGAGAAQAQEETAELFDQYERGEISAETLLSDLDLIANSFDAYNANATKAAEGTAQLTEAQQQYNMALAVANQTLEQYQQNQQIGGQNLAGEHHEAARALELEALSADALADNLARIAELQGGLQGMPTFALTAGDDGSFDAAFQGVKQGAEEYAEAQRDVASAIGDTIAASGALFGVNEDTAAQLEQLAQLQEEYAATFERMQSAATQATDTLDSVFRAVVGNTNAIASQSQSVADWAAELIGAAGTYAQIDDLLTAGAITLDEYTAAQGAYNTIAAANASIQEDVLSIQAQLAPVVATATEALATQMDEIANGSTDAQLFALGMMDAATSSQALALAQGYLQNQDVFGPMIQQAAELNPMLAQILEEMGLISYNPATGEVRLLGVDESQSELEMLTAAMDELNETVATLIAILQDDASGPIGDVQNLLDGLDGDTATVFADLIDNASGGIAAAHAALMALDGASATSYIYTIQQTIGGPGIFALGGVAGYDSGGVVIRAGESGAERLDYPGGGHGMAWGDGLYNVPRGTYVNTAPATAQMGGGGGASVTINISGVTDWDDAARQVSQKLVPALQQAMRQHERSMGWSWS